MRYIVKYCIQKFLICTAMQVLESNNGIKGLQAHTSMCSQDQVVNVVLKV